jgi:hypothetical protein
MDDLSGSATERMEQWALLEQTGRDPEWVERQLVSALTAWQGSEDQLNALREARADY